jgi:3-hydroxyisobutyrate dehydrogenase
MVEAVSKIGWIGTGVMGKSMAKHLMASGKQLLVYNRTASKAEELVAAGATFKTPSEIA